MTAEVYRTMKSPLVGLALAAGLLAGCTTLTPVASIKATVNAPGFPAAPAKVYVDGRSFPQHGKKITREFSERYGAGYREKLEERYAALLAGGDLWAKREAARIEAHANFAPTIAAEFAARGHVLVPRDEADYLVSFSFSAVPWEESMGSDRLPDIDDPKHEANLYLAVYRNPPLPGARSPSPLWRGELRAETPAEPKVYLRTLMQHLGRNFVGVTPLATD